MTLTLGCGPYFDETGLWAAMVTFLVLKPAAYFAFIMAFRYRVNRVVPLSYRRAVVLTVFRAGLGVAIGGAGMALFLPHGADGLTWMWIYLYATRLGAWWLVGRVGAALRGRRLAGWTISGLGLNAAFDVAAISGLANGWLWPAGIMAGIAAFILVLDRVGRRSSLKARFAFTGVCQSCRYDLRGNLSGRCPECGAPVAAAA